jgi:hypothetical protein
MAFSQGRPLPDSRCSEARTVFNDNAATAAHPDGHHCCGGLESHSYLQSYQNILRDVSRWDMRENFPIKIHH